MLKVILLTSVVGCHSTSSISGMGYNYGTLDIVAVDRGFSQYLDESSAAGADAARRTKQTADTYFNHPTQKIMNDCWKKLDPKYYGMPGPHSWNNQPSATKSPSMTLGNQFDHSLCGQSGATNNPAHNRRHHSDAIVTKAPPDAQLVLTPQVIPHSSNPSSTQYDTRCYHAYAAKISGTPYGTRNTHDHVSNQPGTLGDSTSKRCGYPDSYSDPSLKAVTYPAQPEVADDVPSSVLATVGDSDTQTGFSFDGGSTENTVNGVYNHVHFKGGVKVPTLIEEETKIMTELDPLAQTTAEPIPDSGPVEDEQLKPTVVAPVKDSLPQSFDESASPTNGVPGFNPEPKVSDEDIDSIIVSEKEENQGEERESVEEEQEEDGAQSDTGKDGPQVQTGDLEKDGNEINVIAEVHAKQKEETTVGKVQHEQQETNDDGNGQSAIKPNEMEKTADDSDNANKGSERNTESKLDDTRVKTANNHCKNGKKSGKSEDCEMDEMKDQVQNPGGKLERLGISHPLTISLIVICAGLLILAILAAILYYHKSDNRDLNENDDNDGAHHDCHAANPAVDEVESDLNIEVDVNSVSAPKDIPYPDFDLGPEIKVIRHPSVSADHR